MATPPKRTPIGSAIIAFLTSVPKGFKISTTSITQPDGRKVLTIVAEGQRKPPASWLNPWLKHISASMPPPKKKRPKHSMLE